MKRSFVIFVLAAGFASGCSNSKTPNQSNFKAAISQYLARNGKACIPMVQPFPVDIAKTRLNDSSGPPVEMAALEKAGLLQSSNTTVVIHGMIDAFHGTTPPQPVKRYTLTAEGQKYFQPFPTAFGQMNGFCYGQKQVDSIVKWTEPTTEAGASVTQVTYTYKLDPLAGWAKQPDVRRTFSAISGTLNQVGANQEIDLDLTNKGWEAGGS